MSSISFDNPYLLLLAIPLAILLVVSFIIAVRKENANWHSVASCVIHVLLAVIIAFTAAGTTIETTVTKTEVYVLADVSYSSNKNLDTMDGYIKELKANLPRGAEMGVVCFAKEQQLYVRLGSNLKSVRGANTELLNDGETDIESALDYANSLFRNDVIKRIVVISDGKQTHLSDSNALKRAADTLRAENVYVDAVYLDNNISSSAKEIQITSAEVTQNTYLGKAESAEITIQSTYSAQAKLSLYRGSIEIESRIANLTNGYNVVGFNLDTNSEGVFDYRVTVTADDDENKFNNSVIFTQKVSGKARVLLITDNDSDCVDIERAYDIKATVDSYSTNDEIPCSSEQLCLYDEIILSNVDLTKSRDYKAFIEGLDSAVSLFGKSLITYGNVYLHEKEELSSLGSMLPVRFGNADRDSKLYTLVIDASYSMDNYQRFTIAKTAAKQLITKLNEKDNLCIVSFDGNYHPVFMPEEISDTPASGEIYSTRELAIKAVDDLYTHHGTVISYGLQEAVRLIKDLSYGQKQIMLISDGMTVGDADETALITEQLTKLNQYGISASVIDVGRGNDTSAASSSAEALLKSIAQKTGGEYYFASNKDELEVEFGKGLLDDFGSAVIDDNAHINVVRSSDSVLKDIEINPSDYVTGFLYNRSKWSAVTVLESLYERENGKIEKVPLYSYWNYGNGKVSTLACNLDKTTEGLQYVRDKFISNVFDTNTPTEKASYPFVATMIEENGFVNVTLTPARVDTRVKAKITVTGPDDDKLAESQDMSFSSSSYAYRFEPSAVGKYSINVEYIYPGDANYTASFTYNLSYLPEYDAFASYDKSSLQKMVGSYGKVMKDGDRLYIENDESLISTYIYDLTVTLLVISVILFAADVAIRKLRWEDIRSLFGKGKM